MSVLIADSQKQLEQLLVSDNLITKEKIDELHIKSKKTGEPFLSLVIKEGGVSNEELTRSSSAISKIPYVNLLNAKINAKILDLLPLEVAERYMAVPLGEMENKLVVAMLDANNVQAVDFLANRIGRQLSVYMASQEGIENVLKQYQLNVAVDVKATLGSKSEEQKNKQVTDIQTLVQDSPISKALTTIMEFAARSGASDIHIEPLEKELKIRCRIDGILKEIMKLPKSTEPPLISRIKILSNLKIDEHRIPQDGQFTVVVDRKAIDLRIAISPVVWGEQVVIRLLDKSGTSLKLEDMGYSGRALRTIRKGIQNPNGMILTSGPTGSGKSTSLYALIQEIKSDGINIVTLEDPVEYKMDGINQIQVNPEVGLTFASGLRSILRQDPDVVMVGEIRDKETAALAVQAALTGHLVLSTLHTNSAAGILPRLLDMEVEPFLIASTVRTVIGQRLVRRISGEPKGYSSTGIESEVINQSVGELLPKDESEKKKVIEDLGYGDLPLGGQKAYTLFKGAATKNNPNGEYKGRLGLYEVFNVTEEIQDLIIKRATSAEIQRKAQEQGMVTMRQDGVFKALSGRTTLSEVNRVSAEESA